MDVKKIFLFYSRQPDHFNSFITLLNDDQWQVVQVVDIEQIEEFTFKRDNGYLYCLGIFDPIVRSLSENELKLIENFCRSSGHSMIVAGGGENRLDRTTNLNDITSKFGITFNDDCIIRPNLYKQYHPKEAYLRDFIVNRGFSDTLKKYWKTRTDDSAATRDLIGDVAASGPHLLYPYGCSLKVGKAPVVILMTSSQWAIPCRQAICALYGSGITRESNTRVIVVGSSCMLEDRYINQEDNKAIIKTIIEYLVNRSSPINVSDAKTVEIPEVVYGPDLESLLDTPISCIQESEPLPRDKMSLVNKRLFNSDSSKLPEIVRAYHDLNVPYEPLRLIKPELHFESPKLEPAIHDFLLRRPKLD